MMIQDACSICDAMLCFDDYGRADLRFGGVACLRSTDVLVTWSGVTAAVCSWKDACCRTLPAEKLEMCN